MIDTMDLREFANDIGYLHGSGPEMRLWLHKCADELDRVTEELGLAMGTLESRDRNIEAMAEEYRRVTAERDRLLFALKTCAAVCAGESLNKSSLVNALELAHAAIRASEGEK